MGLAKHWFEKWPESDTLVPSTVDKPMPIPPEENENITKAIARQKKARRSTLGVNFD